MKRTICSLFLSLFCFCNNTFSQQRPFDSAYFGFKEDVQKLRKEFGAFYGTPPKPNPLFGNIDVSKTDSWSCYVNLPSLKSLYALFDENSTVTQRKEASISAPKSSVTYEIKKESNPDFFENLYLRHGNTTYNTTTWKQVGCEFSPEVGVVSLSLTYDTIFATKSNAWDGTTLDKNNPKDIKKVLTIKLDETGKRFGETFNTWVSIGYDVIKKTYHVYYYNKEGKSHFNADSYFTKPAKATK